MKKSSPVYKVEETKQREGEEGIDKRIIDL